MYIHHIYIHIYTSYIYTYTYIYIIYVLYQLNSFMRQSKIYIFRGKEEECGLKKHTQTNKQNSCSQMHQLS